MLAALTSAFVHLGIGSVLGFSGVTLPELTDPVSPDLFLNTSQAALFSKCQRPCLFEMDHIMNI